MTTATDSATATVADLRGGVLASHATLDAHTATITARHVARYRALVIGTHTPPLTPGAAVLSLLAGLTWMPDADYAAVARAVVAAAAAEVAESGWTL